MKNHRMTKPPLTTNRYSISDEKWQQIKKLFPTYTTGRPPKLSNRAALNAVLCQLNVDLPWRDLPTEFGSWKTVYSRFRKWTDSGLFEQIFKIICEDDDPDMENVSLDSTTIQVHQKGTGAQKIPLHSRKSSDRPQCRGPHDQNSCRR